MGSIPNAIDAIASSFMICIVHSTNRSLTHRLVKHLYFEDETSALSESMVAFSLIGIVSYFKCEWI